LDFVLKDNPSSLEYLLNLTRRIIRNRKTTVLVVDDSTVALRICGDLLRRYQLNVVEAKSGAQALDILVDRSDIRLVITDHEMPGSSWWRPFGASIAATSWRSSAFPDLAARHYRKSS
jgi:DNA-binding NarL/FixJ family response regulator